MARADSSKTYKQEDIAHLVHGMVDQSEFAKSGNRVIAESFGVKIKDTDGKEYIDARSGAMSVNIGYGNRELADVARAQMIKSAYFPSFAGYTNTPEIALASKLAELTPPGLQRFIFSCGGSEANEAALKLARWYWRVNGRDKYKIISLNGSYHGATYGAMSATGNPSYSTNFEPLVPGFIHIAGPYCYRCPLDKSYPGCGIACTRYLEEAIRKEGEDTVAAFLSEPLSGNIGYLIPPPEYWPKVSEICKQHGVLLIIDEVITGFGRTGKFFASEHWDLRPDIMTMSKGLASSYLPIAGTAMSEKIYQSIKESSTPYKHVHTFGGHPVSCAVALKNIEIMLRDKLVENAARMGEYLEKRLLALMAQTPYIGDVRGRGLWCGVELVADKGTRALFPPEKKVPEQVLSRMLEKGVIIGGFAGHILGIGPPLIITRDELDQVLDCFEGALRGIRI